MGDLGWLESNLKLRWDSGICVQVNASLTWDFTLVRIPWSLGLWGTGWVFLETGVRQLRKVELKASDGVVDGSLRWVQHGFNDPSSDDEKQGGSS